MSGLRKGVRLVDHLRKFAAAEEVLDRRGDALGVDQASRGHVLDVLEAHPLLDGAAELEEPFSHLVARQLVDRPQTAIAQVVDIINYTLRIPKLDQGLGRQQNIFFAQDIQIDLTADPQALIYF